jgi:large subunit ribosomal protein L10
MNRDQKAAVVEEIAGQIRSAEAVFAVDYRGITVAQAAELRVRLRESGTKFRVVKNSLSERAADAAGAEPLKAMLEGPTALAFVSGDAALAAKALSDAARTLRTLEFKGGLMDSTTLSADDVRSIARLPALEVLHAQLVGTIAAPLSGLVRGLNALIAGLAIQLQQIAEKGLVSGQAPAETEAPAEAEAPAVAEAEAPAVAEAEAPAVAEAEAPTAVAEPQAPPESPEEARADEPTAAATPDTTPAPEPQTVAPEPGAEAEPGAAAEAEAPAAEPIVDVEAEPGAESPAGEPEPPIGETETESAPDDEASGA